MFVEPASSDVDEKNESRRSGNSQATTLIGHETQAGALGSARGGDKFVEQG